MFCPLNFITTRAHCLLNLWKKFTHHSNNTKCVIPQCFYSLPHQDQSYSKYQSFFLLFRWFKFTLKPPNSITHGNLLWAIWDTSHWNFFVKFGLKTAWHISYDILWSLLTYVNFWQLQGRLSIFAKIRGPQKIKVFSMKERSVVNEAWGF